MTVGEVTASSAGHFLCESTCEDCGDATCLLAEARCFSCKRASLTTGPVRDPSNFSFFGRLKVV